MSTKTRLQTLERRTGNTDPVLLVYRPLEDERSYEQALAECETKYPNRRIIPVTINLKRGKQ